MWFSFLFSSNCFYIYTLLKLNNVTLLHINFSGYNVGLLVVASGRPLLVVASGWRWVKQKWIRGVVENSSAPARLHSLVCPIATVGWEEVSSGCCSCWCWWRWCGGGVELWGWRRVNVEEEWGEGTVGHYLNLRCLPDSPNISLNIYIYITVYSFPACMHARTQAQTGVHIWGQGWVWNLVPENKSDWSAARLFLAYSNTVFFWILLLPTHETAILLNYFCQQRGAVLTKTRCIVLLQVKHNCY